MNYIDCFVAAVPRANRDAFIAHAKEAGAIFREYGALRIVDCWGDDVPPGKVTSFPLAVQSKDDEDVIVGWVEWPSKAVRDEANAKLMQDPRMQALPMPFDGKRALIGGFAKIQEN
ncbi:MAG: DUF1428 family protein [Alphaproteobacteria bacterium]|nr:DUF1428 family protein [Alphaproteobacteria bacterium]